MRLTPIAAAAALALSLAACGSRDEAQPAGAGASAAPSSKTMAALLREDGQLGSLETMIGSAGLETVLEGVGPYTLFAPTEAAFTAANLGDLSGVAVKARNAALLRAHIVPGALTRADIGAALDRASNGKVEMRTMADGVLTFSREGGSIAVATPDGARAKLSGNEKLASNGVVQPVDALLAKPTPAS